MIGEAGRKIWAKEPEAFELCEHEEFLSVSVVAVVTKGCVCGVEVS